MKDLSKNPRQFNYVDPTLYEMSIFLENIKS